LFLGNPEIRSCLQANRFSPENRTGCGRHWVTEEILRTVGRIVEEFLRDNPGLAVCRAVSTFRGPLPAKVNSGSGVEKFASSFVNVAEAGPRSDWALARPQKKSRDDLNRGRGFPNIGSMPMKPGQASLSGKQFGSSSYPTRQAKFWRLPAARFPVAPEGPRAM